MGRRVNEGRPPVVCSIGTTHPWNVAGLGLDVLLLHELGARPVTVVAGISAQGPDGVVARTPVDAQTIAAQFATLRHAHVDAFRVGALLAPETVRSTGAILERSYGVPAVCDPVIASSDGGILADSATIKTLRDRLFPRCDIVTPNLDEARLLLERDAPIGDLDEMQRAARELCAFGARAILLKGGHLAERAIDVLCIDGETTLFEEPRLATEMRGTGCLLAAALAFELARGASILEAVPRARAIVREKIARARRFAHMRVAY
jgi:hydroxymethylpyrimidine/phosphomethylpyrimidine kinase